MKRSDKLPPKHPSAAARALNKVIGRGRFTVEELASEDLANCSDKHIYDVKNQEATLRHTQMERIARWLCKHGETSVSKAFVAPTHMIVRRMEGTANGICIDDIADIGDACTKYREAHAAGDKEKMDEAIEELLGEIYDLIAERNSV